MSRKIRSDIVPMIGKVFYNLTVIEHDLERSKNRHTYYKCICSCGENISVRADGLRGGTSRSCGCLKAKEQSNRSKTHGLHKHPLYKKWVSIQQRCCNPNNSRYERYGARGIEVCKEWSNNFQSFYDWSILNGYYTGMTLDRINNNGNYCPENCRYINNKQQQYNKSNNHYVVIDGISKTIQEWCDKYNINRNLFNWRLKNGWKDKDLLKESKKTNK